MSCLRKNQERLSLLQRNRLQQLPLARGERGAEGQDREQTAQAILDARALYPDSSLADLYDEVTMPPELRRAHQQNDRAVMEAYGFPASRDFTESDCVARLFEMYKRLTQ